MKYLNSAVKTIYSVNLNNLYDYSYIDAIGVLDLYNLGRENFNFINSIARKFCLNMNTHLINKFIEYNIYEWYYKYEKNTVLLMIALAEVQYNIIQ